MLLTQKEGLVWVHLSRHWTVTINKATGEGFYFLFFFLQSFQSWSFVLMPYTAWHASEVCGPLEMERRAAHFFFPLSDVCVHLLNSVKPYHEHTHASFRCSVRYSTVCRNCIKSWFNGNRTWWNIWSCSAVFWQSKHRSVFLSRPSTWKYSAVMLRAKLIGHWRCWICNRKRNRRYYLEEKKR